MITAASYAEEYWANKRRFEGLSPEKPPKAKKPVRIAPESAISAKERWGLIFLLFFAGAVCIGVIIATAYAAQVKYETNLIIERNAELQGEIENLSVKIKQTTNIKTVEVKAKENLGMINPEPSHFIFIDSEEVPLGDFAMLLREQAYNE